MTYYRYLARLLQYNLLTDRFDFCVADKSKGITDGELKKLKAHIDNGDQMLDNIALEDYRKKIIDELGQKDDAKSGKIQTNDGRKSLESPRNNRSSRLCTPHSQSRDSYRRINDQIRRNSHGQGGNRISFHEQNRNRSRER